MHVLTLKAVSIGLDAKLENDNNDAESSQRLDNDVMLTMTSSPLMKSSMSSFCSIRRFKQDRKRFVSAVTYARYEVQSKQKMLRYYVYFYFCSAAVTIYVGFLDLRFEEINNGVYPAFDLTDDNESNVELARSRVKRKTAGDDQPATGKQLVRKIKEFFRHYQSMKLKRLRGQGPLDRKVKVMR